MNKKRLLYRTKYPIIAELFSFVFMMIPILFVSWGKYDQPIFIYTTSLVFFVWWSCSQFLTPVFKLSEEYLEVVYPTRLILRRYIYKKENIDCVNIAVDNSRKSFPIFSISHTTENGKIKKKNFNFIFVNIDDMQKFANIIREQSITFQTNFDKIK